MKHRFGVWLGLVALLVGGGAHATYHTYQIEEIYSNADGSVQYIVLHEAQHADGQNLLAGKALRVTHGGITRSFVFPYDLPGVECETDYYYSNCPLSKTANTRVLIANEGFAALGIVTPDYVFNGALLPVDGGLVNYADIDFVSYGALPTDGVGALNRSGGKIPNVATNFAGKTASVKVQAPPAKNFQGLWWADTDPPGGESGWGINFAHQGKVVFATWFSYGAERKPQWFIVLAEQSAANANVFSGPVSTVVGSPFDAFDKSKVVETPVGAATLTFAADGSRATFAYTVTGITQNKQIVRQPFFPDLVPPTCAWSAQPNLAAATNFQDLWWADTDPPGGESGWGINFAHQRDTLFATWFTYDADGKPLWFIVLAEKKAPGVYRGPVSTVAGPSFDAVPFDPKMVAETIVGDAAVTFIDGNHASFTYTVTVGGKQTLQSKLITRQLFSPPAGTLCQ